MRCGSSSFCQSTSTTGLITPRREPNSYGRAGGAEMSVSRGHGSVECLTGEERAYHHMLLGTEKFSM
jgi:hypothetical protein